MSLSKRRNSSALIIACLLAATPVLAQQGDPNAGILRQPAPEAMPKTSAECTAYAIQQSNEEYMAQDSSVRRNSPFQTGPGGARDPFTDSQRQQLTIDRSARQQQLYDACVAHLSQHR